MHALTTFCEYFGRYTGAQRGTCTKLPDYTVIVSRYPRLGRVHERFDLISQLTPAIAVR